MSETHLKSCGDYNKPDDWPSTLPGGRWPDYDRGGACAGVHPSSAAVDNSSLCADEEEPVRYDAAGSACDSGDGGPVSVSGRGARDGAGYSDGRVAAQCTSADNPGCSAGGFGYG
jgi:hypothetical protein